MKRSTLDTLADAIADRILERLAEVLPTPKPGALVDAATVAKHFGVSRDFVYAHAAELGAYRMHEGKGAPLRFDPAIVAERLAARPDPATHPERLKPRRRRTTAPLLEIKGEKS